MSEDTTIDNPVEQSTENNTPKNVASEETPKKRVVRTRKPRVAKAKVEESSTETTDVADESVSLVKKTRAVAKPKTVKKTVVKKVAKKVATKSKEKDLNETAESKTEIVSEKVEAKAEQIIKIKSEKVKNSFNNAEVNVEKAVDSNSVDSKTEKTDVKSGKPIGSKTENVEGEDNKARNNNNNNNRNRNNNNNRNGGNRNNKKNNRNRNRNNRFDEEILGPPPSPEKIAEAQSKWKELRNKSISELQQICVELELPDIRRLRKQALLYRILEATSGEDVPIYAEGVLEVLNEGYGFLRSPDHCYLAGPDDIYISPSQVKKCELKTGDTIQGQVRPPRDNEKYFALLRIDTVNSDTIEIAKKRVAFEHLTPLHPDQRFNLEWNSDEYASRMMNLFTPIGKGQRSIILAPPRTGKTVLLQNLANAISQNHPEVKLMVLLIDERPEEVTDMSRNVKGEVLSSTFDEPPERHVAVADMVLEKAKRLVEHGQDVVILLDSITRFARANNVVIPHSGKILSGGVDAKAMQRPKRFFGAARNIENGGSLTIIGTALIETGSRMDEVIFEEFKGTGNMELVLDRRIAEKRIWPAIDIFKSGTRKEELLIEEEELRRIFILRRYLQDQTPTEIVEFFRDKFSKAKTNAEFLASMNG